MLLTKERIVKIADFGLALDTSQPKSVLDADVGGEYLPVMWMAIESIFSGQFTKEADVYVN